MKKYIVYTLLLVAALYLTAPACDPESFLLFGDEARQTLDSLTQIHSADTLTMAILAHNIAFDDSTNTYLKMAKKLFARLTPTPVTRAYLRSVNIMAERNKSLLVKILTKGSLLSRIRAYYGAITTALAECPDNDTLLFLHAGAAIEITDRFPEFLPDARHDLDTLWRLVNRQDSDHLFFLNLLEAKFYYKKGKLAKERWHLDRAWDFVEKACTFACNTHHLSEIDLWEKRIIEQQQKK